MAGIYIHIPFCKSRCIYCGFYTTTSLDMRDKYVAALCSELSTRTTYLQGDISTIYFGGGTPSQLTTTGLSTIFATIRRYYTISANAEITLECNPDDITPQYIRDVQSLGVNRISLGVQTFSDQRLEFIHRRHTAERAIEAVRICQSEGISNISIDLMYGFPDETLDEWIADIDTAISLGVQHISAYSLMYEEGTPLYSLLQRGDIHEIDEELSLAMYKALISRLAQAGYTHYEISNFCLPDYHSRHNSSYWDGTPYLGIGAAAHSFDTHSRQWNPSSLAIYIKGVNEGTLAPEVEHLTTEERYNELVMTGLRTRHGIDTRQLSSTLGDSYYNYCMTSARPLIARQLLQLDDVTGMLTLSAEGVFISNDIMSDLMWVD